MVDADEVEERYRRALAALDKAEAAVDRAVGDEVAQYDAAIRRAHLLIEDTRAKLWAAELGLRIAQDRRESS